MIDAFIPSWILLCNHSFILSFNHFFDNSFIDSFIDSSIYSIIPSIIHYLLIHSFFGLFIHICLAFIGSSSFLQCFTLSIYLSPKNPFYWFYELPELFSDAPATIDKIQTMCQVTNDQLVFTNETPPFRWTNKRDWQPWYGTICCFNSFICLYHSLLAFAFRKRIPEKARVIFFLLLALFCISPWILWSPY